MLILLLSTISAFTIQTQPLQSDNMALVDTSSQPSSQSSSFLQLSERGENPEVVIESSPDSLYLCVGMFNKSNDDELIWLFTNVNNVPDKKDSAVFEQGDNFRDYGEQAVPIRTDYLIKHNLAAGYLGPINPNPSIQNTLPNSTYQLWVSQLSNKSSSNMEEDALKDCRHSGDEASFEFVSNFGQFLQGAAVLLIMFCL